MCGLDVGGGRVGNCEGEVSACGDGVDEDLFKVDGGEDGEYYVVSFSLSFFLLFLYRVCLSGWFANRLVVMCLRLRDDVDDVR